MPIRFRCTQCSRLLGIARRKAGTQTNCPRCGHVLVVPHEDEPFDLAGIDEVVNPHAGTEAETQAEPPGPSPAVATRPAPPAAANGAGRPQPPDFRTPAAPIPTVARKPKPKDDPLFEEDIDEILGLPNQKPDPAAGTGPKAKPVTGMDALSLDEDRGKLVLTPQKATLLVVAVVVLLGLSFAAGFLIASNL